VYENEADPERPRGAIVVQLIPNELITVGGLHSTSNPAPQLHLFLKRYRIVDVMPYLGHQEGGLFILRTRHNLEPITREVTVFANDLGWWFTVEDITDDPKE